LADTDLRKKFNICINSIFSSWR